MKKDSVFSLPLLTLYINRFCSKIGDYSYLVALSLILAKISPTSVMLLWIVKSLGSALALPFSTIIDKLNKKYTLITVDILRGILVLIMPLFLESIFLFLLVGIVSFLGPFFYGSMTPVITILTNKSNRYRVNSIMGLITSSSYFFGPIIGGVLLVQNNALPFIFQGLTFIISTLLFFLIKIPNIPIEGINKNKQINKYKISLTDLKFTFIYIFKRKILFFLICTYTLYMCGGIAIDAYEVLYLTDTLNFSETDYAFSISFLGVAFIIAGLINSAIGKKFKTYNIYIIGIFIASIANLTFAFSYNIYSVIVAFSLLSIGVTLFSASLQTLIQNTVPIEFQGRIVSFQTIIPNIMTTLTVLAAGVLINFVPIRFIIISLALITFLGAILSLVLISYFKKTSYENKDTVANSTIRT